MCMIFKKVDKLEHQIKRLVWLLKTNGLITLVDDAKDFVPSSFNVGGDISYLNTNITALKDELAALKNYLKVEYACLPSIPEKHIIRKRLIAK